MLKLQIPLTPVDWLFSTIFLWLVHPPICRTTERDDSVGAATAAITNWRM
jgi:hypothetical protein